MDGNAKNNRKAPSMAGGFRIALLHYWKQGIGKILLISRDSTFTLFSKSEFGAADPLRYLAVLVVDDKAGGVGREYISELAAHFWWVKFIAPPAHDLSDFWKSGSNLRAWVASHVADALEMVMAMVGVDEKLLETTDWIRIAGLAREEAKLSSFGNNSMGNLWWTKN